MKLTQLYSHWKGVRTGLLETIEKFSGEELDYKPYEGAWSVGEIILHIANAEDGWFRYVVRRQVDQWPEHPLSSYPTMESIKEVLDDVHAETEAYLTTLEIDDLNKKLKAPWGREITIGYVVWHVLEHEIHHRGELSLILGLLGREGLDV